MFEIDREDVDGVGVLRVRGALMGRDASDALLAAAKAAVGDNAFGVVCDLTGVTATDSIGLAALIRTQERLRAAGRRVTFLNPPERLRSLIALTHMERYVDIRARQEDAIQRARDVPPAPVAGTEVGADSEAVDSPEKPASS